jgi:hypothetical protein
MSKLQTNDTLPDELRFTIAVVCKAALVNPPDDLRAPPEGPSGELGDAVDWWKRDGQVWLQHVCAHVRLEFVPAVLAYRNNTRVASY